MNNFVVIIFILVFGSLNSQVLFHFSICRSFKMSFSDVYYNDNNVSEMLSFPDFSVYHSKKTFDQPKRIAFNLGLSVKRHNFHLGIQNDGVSSKNSIHFNSFDYVLNKYRPNSIFGTAKTPQSRLSLNYDFYILKKEKKSNLFFTTTIGLCYRAGPIGIGPVGTLGTVANLSPTKTLQSTSASYTSNPKYVFNFGGGLGTDLFLKNYYILTLSAGFTYSNKSLYFTNHTIIINENSSSQEYTFKTMYKCTSAYFGISRRFQLFPWKSIKNNPIWDEFHTLN
jgi:hypothetical protein